MYAIIETGGKQYRVAENECLTIERLQAEPGQSLEISRVLLLAQGDKIELGRPTVPNAKVMARVLSQQRGRKLRVAKFKRRKGYFKRQGHRQALTTVRIEKILV